MLEAEVVLLGQEEIKQQEELVVEEVVADNLEQLLELMEQQI